MRARQFSSEQLRHKHNPAFCWVEHRRAGRIGVHKRGEGSGERAFGQAWRGRKHVDYVKCSVVPKVSFAGKLTYSHGLRGGVRALLREGAGPLLLREKCVAGS